MSGVVDSVAMAGVDSQLIPITVRPVNDPPMLILPVDEQGTSETIFIDEEENIRVSGVKHTPYEEIQPSFEYIASIGFELFRSEGARPDFDSGEWGERTSAAGGSEGLADDKVWRQSLVRDIKAGPESSSPRYF